MNPVFLILFGIALLYFVLTGKLAKMVKAVTS